MQLKNNNHSDIVTATSHKSNIEEKLYYHQFVQVSLPLAKRLYMDMTVIHITATTKNGKQKETTQISIAHSHLSSYRFHFIHIQHRIIIHHASFNCGYCFMCE